MNRKLERGQAEPSDNGVAAILSAAMIEFGRHGLTGARIADIAKTCGKSKQLIYHYYDSKDELFSAVIWDCLQRSMRNMCVPAYDNLPANEALRLFLITMSDQTRLCIPMMLDENIHGGAHMRNRSP